MTQPLLSAAVSSLWILWSSAVRPLRPAASVLGLLQRACTGFYRVWGTQSDWQVLLPAVCQQSAIIAPRVRRVAVWKHPVAQG